MCLKWILIYFSLKNERIIDAGPGMIVSSLHDVMSRGDTFYPLHLGLMPCSKQTKKFHFHLAFFIHDNSISIDYESKEII